MHAVFYNGPVNAGGMRNCQQALADAVAKGHQKLTLVLTSNGGDVASGMGLYHFIRSLPVPVTTHAAGVCSSVAATILLAADRRTGADPTHFILHVATYREGPNKGKPALHTAAVIQPYRTRLGWSEARIAEMFTPEERALTIEDALQLGMVQEICDLQLTPETSTTIVPIPKG
jgi:ATP-dependent protease ClpP protease subunit